MTEAARSRPLLTLGNSSTSPGAVAETRAEQGWVTEGLYPCHLLCVLEESALSAVESTYRIEFQEWYRPQGLRDVRTRSPGFRVRSNLSGEGSGLFVGVLLSGTASAILMAKLGLEHEDEDGLEIDEFLLKHGVQVITERLRDGTWQAAGLPQEIPVNADELDEILAAQAVKQCDYQLADGRDLYCIAAAKNDDTIVGSVGVRFVAPTSRSTCAACSMPDSRLVCSHLHHPQVYGHPVPR